MRKSFTGSSWLQMATRHQADAGGSRLPPPAAVGRSCSWGSVMMRSRWNNGSRTMCSLTSSCSSTLSSSFRSSVHCSCLRATGVEGASSQQRVKPVGLGGLAIAWWRVGGWGRRWATAGTVGGQTPARYAPVVGAKPESLRAENGLLFGRIELSGEVDDRPLSEGRSEGNGGRRRRGGRAMQTCA